MVPIDSLAKFEYGDQNAILIASHPDIGTIIVLVFIVLSQKKFLCFLDSSIECYPAFVVRLYNARFVDPEHCKPFSDSLDTFFRGREHVVDFLLSPVLAIFQRIRMRPTWPISMAPVSFCCSPEIFHRGTKLKTYTSMRKSWPFSRLFWVSPIRIGKIAVLSIRAALTQSEEGVWRFSCNTCLIDAGAALERATMAAATASLSANILRCWGREAYLRKRVGRELLLG
jgi:hypothetical protein